MEDGTLQMPSLGRSCDWGTIRRTNLDSTGPYQCHVNISLAVQVIFTCSFGCVPFRRILHDKGVTYPSVPDDNGLPSPRGCLSWNIVLPSRGKLVGFDV